MSCRASELAGDLGCLLSGASAFTTVCTALLLSVALMLPSWFSTVAGPCTVGSWENGLELKVPKPASPVPLIES